ncbi:segregation and condensation protein A [Moraxella nonliquefaciens]|jgi:scpA/B protein|uniref:segregation and condensation protein A n=1 Tax=Moraxella nonliquefaciens TaxID=478 RepID=UPI001EF7416B|nr:ScpA family protein [Moraxella nonliquefaciens]MCG7412787.1 segregation/condensation protein A [Moraxella nonliquefaciens]
MNTPQSDAYIRIFDTPVSSLPDDLYIPPQAFAIWLEQFAGPLDFLLYLVKKNNFDLTQTAILPITEQYLTYIKELDDTYFELAGDYLLMASTLITIKSELLLPKPKITEEELSPKARLIRRLEEYAQIKEASLRLDNLIRLERDVFLAFVSLPTREAMRAKLPNYSSQILINSLINMQIKPDYQMHHIKTDPVPLPERIAKISLMLSQQGSGTFVQLLDKTQGRVGVVVSFVAVLELLKRGLIGFACGDDALLNSEINTDIIQSFQLEVMDAPIFQKSKQKDPLFNINNTGFDLSEQTLYWLH